METKFGLPHSVVVYLNGGNGYPATVEGLLQLANDVLGGVVTNISPSAVNEAVDVINNAFDECRILVRTIPYHDQPLPITKVADRPKQVEINKLSVVAFPNPYNDQFQLQVKSPESGRARIEFFTVNGQKVFEMYRPVIANHNMTIPYNGPTRFATLAYKVTIGNHIATGIVIKPN